jgi:hypothetical protein
MFVLLQNRSYNVDQIVHLEKIDGYYGPSIKVEMPQKYEYVKFSSPGVRDMAYDKLLEVINTTVVFVEEQTSESA